MRVLALTPAQIQALPPVERDTFMAIVSTAHGMSRIGTWSLIHFLYAAAATTRPWSLKLGATCDDLLMRARDAAFDPFCPWFGKSWD